MKTILLFLAMLLAPLAAAACSTFQSPAQFGCSADEANECRIIQAALIVKAANVTIGEALTARSITPNEAARLRSVTRSAEEAVAAARDALTLESGTLVQRLQAVNVILLQLLREQVIKAGT